jgi:hypothetical protein
VNRLIIGALGGALFGAVLTYALLGPGKEAPPTEVVRDIVVAEKMSVAVADELRADRYSTLHSVEQIYALPTEFGRAEALYAIAGRQDSAGVQNLIFEANRIADAEDRSGALNILFFRLTEMDPQSALALTRMDELRGDRGLERRVWISWGRRDLNAALAAASAQSSAVQRDYAAQSLYTGFGFMGNVTTDRIEEALGIKPDRNVRGRFIYRLADESPARAIAFINSMESGVKQEEMVSWLAFHMAQRDPEQAASYAVLFDNQRYKKNYEQIIARNVAAANPVEILDRILASGRTGLSRSQIYSAMRGVAAGDLDVAMSYYDRLQSAEDKTIMADAIANALAGRDVDAALAWARANETGDVPELEMQVLQKLAQTDMPRAIAEAQNAVNPQMRNSMLTTIIQVGARSNPQEAIEYVSLIENPNMRDDAAQQAISTWLRTDTDAAVDWLLAQDRDTVDEYLGASPGYAMRSNVDAAIRLLPLVEERNQQMWRSQIARTLTTQRSPSEAMSFIRQFEGEPGYAGLQAAVITGVAQHDVVSARLMADQLPDGDAKDSAYVTLVQTRAASHPQEAIAWLGLISSDAQRGRAASNIVGQWYGNDPQGAERWVHNLPSGGVRDNAISGLVGQWHDYGPEQEALIASIENDGIRTQARVRQVYTLMQRDPVRAREVMEGADLPESERQRLESSFKRMNNRM